MDQTADKTTVEKAGAGDGSTLLISPHPEHLELPISLLPMLASLCLRTFSCSSLATHTAGQSNNGLELVYEHSGFLPPWVG